MCGSPLKKTTMPTKDGGSVTTIRCPKYDYETRTHEFYRFLQEAGDASRG
jgi:hypothetical protein